MAAEKSISRIRKNLETEFSNEYQVEINRIVSVEFLKIYSIKKVGIIYLILDLILHFFNVFFKRL